MAFKVSYVPFNAQVNLVKYTWMMGTTSKGKLTEGRAHQEIRYDLFLIYYRIKKWLKLWNFINCCRHFHNKWGRSLSFELSKCNTLLTIWDKSCNFLSPYLKFQNVNLGKYFNLCPTAFLKATSSLKYLVLI